MEAKDRVMKHFDDVPIGRRLKVAFFGIAGAILLVACIALFMLVDQRQKINQLSNYTINMIESSLTTRINLSNMRGYVLGLSMTNDQKLVSEYEQLLNNEKDEFFAGLKVLSEGADNESSRRELEDVGNLIKQMVDIENQMIAYGRNGQVEEAITLLEKSYMPNIDETNNLLIKLCEKVEAEKDYMISASYIRATIMMVALALISVVVMIQARRLSRRVIYGITKPLHDVEQAMDALRSGNLSYKLTYSSNNELGSLADKIRMMQKELYKYITNIDFVTNRMAEKDFTVKVDIDYIGDFSNIKVSFGKILNMLKHITSSIRETANGVRIGSEQISEVSASLADGATDQSSTVEELQAALSDVSGQVDINAKDVHTVSDMASEAQRVIIRGNEHMNNLVIAMNEISQSSEKIENIITVIEGISGQTNMLALNASIEAARAGEQGRGFSVVAGEIGKLATETNSATKSTSDLIHQSLNAVRKGVSLVDETAEILKNVVQAAEKIAKLADNVSGASAKQATTIEEIHKAVEQISNVVQDNASIAQEAASSSEELTAHATVLSDILHEFKL